MLMNNCALWSLTKYTKKNLILAKETILWLECKVSLSFSHLTSAFRAQITSTTLTCWRKRSALKPLRATTPANSIILPNLLSNPVSAWRNPSLESQFHTTSLLGWCIIQGTDKCHFHLCTTAGAVTHLSTYWTHTLCQTPSLWDFMGQFHPGIAQAALPSLFITDFYLFWNIKLPAF